MPRTVSGDFFIAGTSPFYDSKKLCKEDLTLCNTVFNQELTADEKSMPAEVNHAEEPTFKLPVLFTFKGVTDEDKKDLQVLLKVRRFELIPEGTQTSEAESTSKTSSSFPENSSEESGKDSCERGKFCDKSHLNCKSNWLPLLPFSSVVQGERVNLRGQKRSNEQRKQRQKATLELKLNQAGSKSQASSDTSNINLKYQTRGNVVSLTCAKNDARPVFHLSKVDKYDIRPGGTPTGGKMCRVFRLNDLKTSLIYTEHNDSWVPSRNKYRTNYSIFKAIMQQPRVFLKQPSPVAGVKMTLQEPGDSFAAAIQAVEETNLPPPPVDTELIPQVKKIVVKLPPIC